MEVERRTSGCAGQGERSRAGLPLLASEKILLGTKSAAGVRSRFQVPGSRFQGSGVRKPPSELAFVVGHKFRCGMTMALDDVVADEPSECAADQHIDWEMILAHYASRSEEHTSELQSLRH